MIRWSEPGYVVGFTTRVGGVSQGPYASLNLGRGTGDDVQLVDENRRRVCAELGADPSLLAANRQVHSSIVNRAEPGRLEPGDGVWTDEPQVPMLATVADCVPIAIAARGRGRLALLHAGWRGLADGLLATGAATVRGRDDDVVLSAIIGPSAGPCCYEVGREVSERFDPDLTSARRKLDLWTAAERLLHAAGVAVVQRADMCTICNPHLFFSHRRDGKPRGVQGVIGYVA